VQLAGPGCLLSPRRVLVSFTATSPPQPSPRRPTIRLQMVPTLTMQKRCTAIGGKTRLQSMRPGMPTSLAWRRAWDPMLSKPLPSSFLLRQTVHLRFTHLVVLNLTTTSRFAPWHIILASLKANIPRRCNCSSVHTKCADTMSRSLTRSASSMQTFRIFIPRSSN
jgi:hypothetical protein